MNTDISKCSGDIVRNKANFDSKKKQAKQTSDNSKIENKQNELAASRKPKTKLVENSGYAKGSKNITRKSHQKDDNEQCRIDSNNIDCVIKNCKRCIISNNHNCTIQNCEDCLICNNVSCKLMNDAILKHSEVSNKNCEMIGNESCKIFENEDSIVRMNRLCTISGSRKSFITLHEHEVIKSEQDRISINAEDWFLEKISKNSVKQKIDKKETK